MQNLLKLVIFSSIPVAMFTEFNLESTIVSFWKNYPSATLIVITLPVALVVTRWLIDLIFYRKQKDN